jgi:hypothetical protein
LPVDLALRRRRQLITMSVTMTMTKAWHRESFLPTQPMGNQSRGNHACSPVRNMLRVALFPDGHLSYDLLWRRPHSPKPPRRNG